jgi:hypothetical protein
MTEDQPESTSAAPEVPIPDSGRAGGSQPVRGGPVRRKPRLPGINQPIPSETRRSSRWTRLALAGSALILLSQFFFGILLSGGAHDAADLLISSFVGTAIFLLMAAGMAALLNAMALGKNRDGKRFAIFLLANSLVLGLVVDGICYATRKKERAKPAAVAPPSPIAFDADRLEITPSPGWLRSNRLAAMNQFPKVEIELSQPDNFILLGVWIIRKQSFKEVPTLSAAAQAGCENLLKLDPTVKLTGGPKPVRGAISGIQYTSSTTREGAGFDEVLVFLDGKDIFIQVLAMGSPQDMSIREAEIEAMIASIRER